MLWKKPLIRKNPDNPQENIFSALHAEVYRVRKDGEGPLKDPDSFSKYLCDLCHAPGQLSGLRQCVICGRWGCSNCWIEEFYLCKSCGGIMKMLMMNINTNDQTTSSPDSTTDEIITENSL